MLSGLATAQESERQRAALAAGAASGGSGAGARPSKAKRPRKGKGAVAAQDGGVVAEESHPGNGETQVKPCSETEATALTLGRRVAESVAGRPCNVLATT